MEDYISSIYAKNLEKRINEIGSFDKILFARYTQDNKLEYIGCKEIKEFVINDDDNSIVLTSIETALPIIQLDIGLSFIYNPKYDNPCKLDIKSMAVIPTITPNTKRPFGVFILYHIKESKLNFSKEEVNKIDELISSENLDDSNLKNVLGDEYGKDTQKSKNNCKDELERANRFFASVVHDIRTPMNAIMGFLELLEQDATPQQKDYIKAAYSSSEMIVALVNDVLDFSKISMGKMDIAPYYFAPLLEFKDSALLFYHLALKKRIKLIVYFDPSTPKFIKTDPHRLRQIINNLLSNAIKFTPEEGIVTLEFLYDKLKDALSVVVTDTGIGMSEEEQKSIFQPYKQATKTTAQNYGGTGLGLTISKQLSALLGGELKLSSKPNEGSKFTLTIPCNSVPGTPPSIEVTPEMLQKSVTIIKGKRSTPRWIEFIDKYLSKLKIPHYILNTDEILSSLNEAQSDVYIAVGVDYIHSDFKQIVEYLEDSSLVVISYTPLEDIPYISPDTAVLNPPIFPNDLINAIYNLNFSGNFGSNKIEECESKTVLVVDDNPINLKFMQEIAKRLGHTCLTALNGKEAIAMLNMYDIDIALIDKNMPVKNGIETIKEIRQRDEFKGIKLYGLTGDSDKETIDEMVKAGANAIFTKPINSKKIKEILCK